MLAQAIGFGPIASESTSAVITLVGVSATAASSNATISTQLGPNGVFAVGTDGIVSTATSEVPIGATSAGTTGNLSNFELDARVSIVGIDAVSAVGSFAIQQFAGLDGIAAAGAAVNVTFPGPDPTELDRQAAAGAANGAVGNISFAGGNFIAGVAATAATGATGIRIESSAAIVATGAVGQIIGTAGPSLFGVVSLGGIGLVSDEIDFSLEIGASGAVGSLTLATTAASIGVRGFGHVGYGTTTAMDMAVSGVPATGTLGSVDSAIDASAPTILAIGAVGLDVIFADTDIIIGVAASAMPGQLIFFLYGAFATGAVGADAIFALLQWSLAWGAYGHGRSGFAGVLVLQPDPGVAAIGIAAIAAGPDYIFVTEDEMDSTAGNAVVGNFVGEEPGYIVGTRAFGHGGFGVLAADAFTVTVIDIEADGFVGSLIVTTPSFMLGVAAVGATGIATNLLAVLLPSINGLGQAGSLADQQLALIQPTANATGVANLSVVTVAVVFFGASAEADPGSFVTQPVETVTGVVASGASGSLTITVDANMMGIAATGTAVFAVPETDLSILGAPAAGVVASVMSAVAIVVFAVSATGAANISLLQRLAAIQGVWAAALGAADVEIDDTVLGVAANSNLASLSAQPVALLFGLNATGGVDFENPQTTDTIFGAMASGAVGAVILTGSFGYFGVQAIGHVGGETVAEFAGIVGGPAVSSCGSLMVSVTNRVLNGVAALAATATYPTLPTNISANNKSNGYGFGGYGADGYGTGYGPPIFILAQPIVAATVHGVWAFGAAEATVRKFTGTLMGVSATGEVGPLAEPLAIAISSAVAHGHASGLGDLIAMTPLSATAVGVGMSPASARSAVINGVNASAQTGRLFDSMQNALVGVNAINVAAGLGPLNADLLAGAVANSMVGDVAMEIDQTRAVSAVGVAALLFEATQVVIIAATAVAAVGAVLPDDQSTVVGIAAQGFIGSVAAVIAITVTGVQAAGLADDTFSGVQATGSVGAVLPRPWVSGGTGISGIALTVTASLPLPTAGLIGAVLSGAGQIATVVSGQLVDIYAAPRVINVLYAATDSRQQIYTLAKLRRHR